MFEKLAEGVCAWFLALCRRRHAKNRHLERKNTERWSVFCFFKHHDCGVSIDSRARVRTMVSNETDGA